MHDTGIDFHHIRPLAGDVRYGFEELVCQLARRNAPSNAERFRRVDGAGGDGGVEAYWICSNGAKTGYQAKYFLRTGDIDWTQVDDSVSKALDTHPEIKRYIVAFACDLTDKSGKKRKGKSGWEHWETHEGEWKSWAEDLELSVSFEVWDKSSLIDKLSDENCVGLREYWFNLPNYSHDWFRGQFARSKADLGERYHPEDHVEVEVDRVFDGLLRSPDFLKDLQRYGAQLSTDKLRRCLDRLSDLPLQASVETIERDVASLHSALCFVDISPVEKLPLQQCRDTLKSCIHLLLELIRSIRELGDSSDATEDLNRRLTKAGDAADDLFYSLEDLDKRLDEANLDIAADEHPVAIVYGEAGSGKSHLFGSVVEAAINREQPALLLLGQYFTGEDPFQTILTRLGLQGQSTDSVLGALDVAAEATRTRCLILIDALNESRDLKIWDSWLSGLVEEIKKYSHLAVAVSCRSEYYDVLIPKSLRDLAPKVECLGFTTAVEQENAAQQYIEKRGLTRPAVPWLAPEFMNPLFLRICCDALKSNGRTEFPKGLRGSNEILQFYLKSLAGRLRTRFASSTIRDSQIESGVISIASKMAESELYDITPADATHLLDEAFEGLPHEPGKSWLDILEEEGLFRREICFSDSDEPLGNVEEVIRFTYQRFSGQLIVNALLDKVSEPRDLFKSGDPAEDFGYLWGPLSTLIPEKWEGTELVDVLPGGLDVWWKRPDIQHAFVQSILWRSTDSFSDRTNSLFGKISHAAGMDQPTILLHTATMDDHPWNASLLHNALSRWKMPERDAKWSKVLARATDIKNHPIHSLTDWVMRADLKTAENEALRLAAITLTWSLTTPSRPIRDRSTKALVRLFSAKPALLPNLIGLFSNVDDLYVLERFYAAAFGAACREMENDTLRLLASSIYRNLFENGSPPLNILLRDYALGIIELAEARGCLDPEIDLTRCKPPYSSPWPIEPVTEDQLKAVAEAAGGNSILRSASDRMGDFGCYEIRPGVHHFSSVPLSKPRPLNQDEMFDLFLEKSRRWAKEKKALVTQLQQALGAHTEYSLRRFIAWKNATDSYFDESEEMRLANEISKRESSLLDIMTSRQRQIYEDFAVPKLFPDRRKIRIAKFHDDVAMKWVAKRAYDYGWSKDLETPGLGFGASRDRPRVERMGKKYQWLALSELLATLADNVWMIDSYPERAFVNTNIEELGSMRDIDPTIITSSDSRLDEHSSIPWWFPRTVEFLSESDDAVSEWPFEDRDLLNTTDLIDLTDVSGRKWLSLYSFYSEYEWVEGDARERSLRRDAWVRISSVIVPQSKKKTLLVKLAESMQTDPTVWGPPDCYNGPFYLEYPWRQNWKRWLQLTDEEAPAIFRDSNGIRPVVRYVWERHSDATLNENHEAEMPSPILMEKMRLKHRILSTGEFENEAGRLAFQNPGGGTDLPSAVLVDHDQFLAFLKDEELACVWIIAGEKSARPDGDQGSFFRRSHTTLHYQQRYRWKSKFRVDDTSCSK